MSNEAALILASALLLATMIVPWFTIAWPLWMKAAWRLVAFILLTVLVQRILGSPFAPQLVADPPGERLWQQVMEIGWWVIAAQSAIGITRLFLVFEAKPRETRIVSDLIAAVIHLVVSANFCAPSEAQCSQA